MGNLTINPRLFLAFQIAAFLSLPAIGQSVASDNSLRRFGAAVPNSAEDFRTDNALALTNAAAKIQESATALAFDRGRTDARQWLAATGKLLEIKARVDAALSDTLELRRQLPAIPDDDRKRESIRHFLVATSTLIDLSGRLRYLLRDAIGSTAHACAGDRAQRIQLIDLLIDHRSGVGAAVMSVLLEEPPQGSRAVAADAFVRGKVLVLLAVSQESDLLPQVAKFIRNESTSDPLLVMSVECIQRLGLPQDPHPDQDARLPLPAITAKELHQRLTAIDSNRLPERSASKRTELLKWLHDRMTKGVTEDSYRFFGHDVRDGDWLLMRNPSPYNLFTDLSPGLFTHVGVVTTHVDERGYRRFVIVDLPERGERIPVGNVDAYVLETLHYFFVRHPDAHFALQLGAAAREMIGNPLLFDLNFDTSRVAAYREGELPGRTIHTYCAGFLMICAMRSDAPLSDFFPIREQAAAGNTQENLQTLGLSIGDDFVSPTAALFSEQLAIVGRRRPMYDPAREVQEAVYDHFAKQMKLGTIRPSPNATQALREKLAQLSADNTWLRRALAKASGVSEKMDLAAAAKAAAVVETLDEIADANRKEFLLARSAFYPTNSVTRDVDTPPLEDIRRIRARHAVLYELWRGGRVSPHQLQTQLVEYYATRGRQQLNARFFTPK